jgi:tetratricopeptide (TPR) repeat protein
LKEENAGLIDSIRRGVAAAESEEYLLALTLFADAYGENSELNWSDRRVANGLSYYALSLALVDRKFKLATETCRRAIGLQFYNGRHYENLAKVYAAAGKRKRSIEVIDEGLKILPEDKRLENLRKEFGLRSRPPIPFLDRQHPLNVSLGISRAARKKKLGI